MSTPSENKRTTTEQLLTHAKELIKQYLVYDGNGRMVETYVAKTEEVDNGVCLKTTYEYDGTSTRIIKMKEENAVWDATWDI